MVAADAMGKTGRIKRESDILHLQSCPACNQPIVRHTVEPTGVVRAHPCRHTLPELVRRPRRREEAALQAETLAYARRQGWKVYHTKDSRGSEPGMLDMLAVRPPRVVLAEFKSATGRLSTTRRYTKAGRPLSTQREWFEAFAACPGVETYLWRPRDQARILQVLR